jgi:oligopeptidase B
VTVILHRMLHALIGWCSCREPTKWVATLRLQKTDSNMLVHKINMGAGHFSQSGRFDILKEAAVELAFVLKCFGKHTTISVSES